MKNLFVIFISTLLFGSCSTNNLSDELKIGLIKNKKIMVSDLERDYDLYIPENQSNSPVVILLHGHRSNSDDITGESGKKAPYKAWISLASQNNIVLLIPNGLKGSDNETGWNDCRADAPGNPITDDVEFIKQALNKVEIEYSINRNKMFVNGTSNGGHMAIRLAQDAPEITAAIAVVAALMPVNSSCVDSSVPVSALFINGTDDPIAPYNGGEMTSNRGEVLSLDESMNYWINRNGTNSTPQSTSLSDLNPGDNSTVEKIIYPNGTNNTEVAHYKILGGGHTEPSIQERYSNLFLLIVGEQNGDIEMAHEAWDFFKNKSK